MTQQDQTIFNEGWTAYFRGKSNVDNPYTSNDEAGLAELWNDGYFEAFDAEQERRENTW